MQYAKCPVLLALVILVAGCASVTSTREDIHSTLQAIDTKQAEMIGRGDATGIAAQYTSNAQMRPPNQEQATGHQAIEKYWQTELRGGPVRATITSVEAENCGDTAWDVGTYLIAGTDGKVLDKGKYTTIWKRENGQWKLHRDTINSDLPAAKQ